MFITDSSASKRSIVVVTMHKMSKVNIKLIMIITIIIMPIAVAVRSKRRNVFAH
jgi:hypothetical protein